MSAASFGALGRVGVVGHAQGLREGREEGRREMLATNVLAVLKARGIEASPGFTEGRALFDALSDDALMAAAVACTDEADFRRRLRESRGLHAEHPPYPDLEE